MAKTQALSASTGNAEEEFRPTFQDWSRFVSFQPPTYYRPRSLEELKGALTSMLQGEDYRRSLRVLGGMHSCSDVCVSDMVVDVSDLPRTIAFNADHTVVTVSANWHLHDFLLALSEHGKALNATGGMDRQTLAGLISTDTAPATSRYAIYDLVEWVEYITVGEDGHSIVEKRVSQMEPAFHAAICSLGAIGILTQVQFRLVDEPCFETIQKIIKLNDVLADVSETSRRFDFWRVDWIPDTDQGLLWAAERIPQADPDGDYAGDQAENILLTIFRVLDKIGPAGPILDNAMRVVYAGLALTYGETKVSGPLRNMLPVDRRAPLHVAMAEWSFRPADLGNLMAHCREYFQQSGWPNLPIEIELTKTDSHYMSPWNWPGLDYIVKFNFMYLTDVSGTVPEREKIRTHLHGLWNHLIQAGIPFKAHWGKINFMDYEFVQAHYDLAQFKPFMRPLFLNKYLTDRLSPAS